MATSKMARYYLSAVLMTTMIGVSLLVLMTWDHGMGMTPDSTLYITSVESLMQGDGYTVGLTLWADDALKVPNTTFPPGYPLFLGAFMLLGFGGASAAMVGNILLYIGSVAMFAWHVYWRSGPSVISLIAIPAFALSDVMLAAHSYILSEALLIFLIMAAASLLDFAIMRRAADWWLIIVAVAVCGLAAIVKYTGVACAIFIILLLQARATRNRIITTIIALMAMFIPLSAWFFRNMVVSGATAAHAFKADSNIIERMIEAGVTIGTWFMPVWKFRTMMGIAGLFIVAGILIAFYRHRSFERPLWSIITEWLTVFPLAYVLVLIIIAAFLGPVDPLENRLMSPAYPAVMLLFVFMVNAMKAGSAGTNAARSHRWLVLFAAAMLLTNIADGMIMTYRSVVLFDGLGYRSAKFRNSQTIQTATALARERSMEVYSNEPFVFIERGCDKVKSLRAPALPEVSETMHDRLVNRRAIVALVGLESRYVGYFLQMKNVDVMKMSDGYIIRPH